MNNLNESQFRCILEHLYNSYKDCTWALNPILFREKWENVLLTSFQNDFIPLPAATAKTSNGQSFFKKFFFSNIEFDFEFDVSVASFLSPYVSPIYAIPISLFETDFHSYKTECFIYDYCSITNEQPISNQPIIIANLPINSNILGYVIDGNHRVSNAKITGQNLITARILDENSANSCILHLIQKALHMYLCDIDDILQNKLNNNNLYNRIKIMEAYLEKVQIEDHKDDSKVESVYKVARATNGAEENPVEKIPIAKEKLDLLDTAPESDIE